MLRPRGRAIVVGALALAFAAAAAETASAADARFGLVHGCYALRAQSLGRLVVKDMAGSYTASATAPAGAEPFRMQATGLGRYLLYGKAKDFLAAGPGPLPGSDRVVRPATAPSPSADWRVEDAAPGAFRLALPSGKVLAASKDTGRLVLADAKSAGGAALFAFVRTTGCAVYPEIATNAVGRPLTRSPSYGETRGLVDAHMHMMAFEFLGGRVHCGRPWGAYGVAYAMVDCPDHYPNGAGAVLENILYGNPARTHDPVGWPTFKDWPHHKSLTHEDSYYRWIERAWRGGLRVYVNLFVENKVLCELYPLKRNSCDEMDAVRLQARRIRELVDYIDAQSGGPGKGFFRIVTSPSQARRVINSGKLAVVLGIEVSEPFGCRLYNGEPQCDKGDIDRGLDEVYKLGVRQMEIINKFDNALGGVAGDGGETGVVVNSGNRYETGRYWDMRRCTGPPDESDKPQPTALDHNTDALVGNAIRETLPPGTAPVYPPGPQCNARGLSDLGAHLVRRLMERKMVFDPDHLSVKARKEALSIVERARYSGVASSHSWSTKDAYPRIYKLGGFVAPYAGSSEGFVEAWKQVKAGRDDRFYFGFGYGADMNGFGAQGGPRTGATKPVRYPFKSFDGGVTLRRQVSGQRVYDINVDGVAHYGLYPDWVQDLRMLAGDEIVRDMARGPEAYLQMWERATGAPRRCTPERARFGGSGLGTSKLGQTPGELLMRTGQPQSRTRAWRYCVRGGVGGARVAAVFGSHARLAAVLSSAQGHEAGGVGPGAAASSLRGRATRLGPGLFVAPSGSPGSRFVYRVRGGVVRQAGVAARFAVASADRLRSYLRLAGFG